MCADFEKARKVIAEILDIYPTRGKDQSKIAEHLNAKYDTRLTTSDISEILQQNGYWHTISRDDKKRVLDILPKPFRDHLNPKK